MNFKQLWNKIKDYNNGIVSKTQYEQLAKSYFLNDDYPGHEYNQNDEINTQFYEMCARLSGMNAEEYMKAAPVAYYISCVIDDEGKEFEFDNVCGEHIKIIGRPEYEVNKRLYDEWCEKGIWYRAICNGNHASFGDFPELVKFIYYMTEE